MIRFTLTPYARAHGLPREALGFVPLFVDEADDRRARDQIHERYAHGGGWHSYRGFSFNPETQAIKHPGDDELPALATAKLRDETLIFYPHAWLLILQQDGSYDIARIDQCPSLPNPLINSIPN